MIFDDLLKMYTDKVQNHRNLIEERKKIAYFNFETFLDKKTKNKSFLNAEFGERRTLFFQSAKIKKRDKYKAVFQPLSLLKSELVI